MTRRSLPTAFLLSLLVATGGLTACRKKVEPAPVPATEPVAQPVATNVAPTSDEERRRLDSLAAARAAEAAAAAAAATASQAELAQLLLQKVYFDYDADVLRDDATATLELKAAILLANPAVSVTIVGNTDERGTAEYNLALGQRRAAQVKRYLVARGVPDGRLVTQSLGDSSPAATGTDEAAFQQNRRAEFQVQNAGALVRPRS